ncbi:MAG: LysM peptidoglycan-binding domain-containing protein [Dechloromonas sp.]|uniref:LysM peptidoglycan-binding domain-containing protein n=1 Tax=Candidatus Dechloromonas phosphorivorans TaxID=2899244 RepID=A0A935KAM9_9RHOO|nr:LysM peptidoglycan-binding domain-containing protein [Candidatus Dechloromonas phosphorivorans]
MTIQDFARQHLKSGLVDALIDFNGIKDPHHLPPGMVLHIPDKWLFRGSRPVTVLDVTGAASRVVANGTVIPLKAGERIPARSHIVTADQESVVLQFSDGSRMLVREHSQKFLQNNKFVPLAEGRDIRLNIPKGKVETRDQQTSGGQRSFRKYRLRPALPQFGAPSSGSRSFPMKHAPEVLEGKVALAHKNGPHSALPAGYGIAMQKNNSRVERQSRTESTAHI